MENKIGFFRDWCDNFILKNDEESCGGWLYFAKIFKSDASFKLFIERFAKSVTADRPFDWNKKQELNGWTRVDPNTSYAFVFGEFEDIDDFLKFISTTASTDTKDVDKPPKISGTGRHRKISKSIKESVADEIGTYIYADGTVIEIGKDSFIEVK